ncbi:hypothetical protein K488DRAFT_71847 [Vararia minispora EC-137]|uniref:Uncharacterized protein n=1 Tax=Vararia minispora EC-137 TaxID=1314806 RepID=A0ACB8QGU7_9AGAM|nr:hypothetical protein K488DRAFT_71847 [Vararia minispora EC-137]
MTHASSVVRSLYFGHGTRTYLTSKDLPIKPFRSHPCSERTCDPWRRTARTIPAPSSESRKHWTSYGISIKFSTELTGLREDDNEIIATTRVRRAEDTQSTRIKFVVGADGATCHLLGVPPVGRSRDQFNLLIGDTEPFGLSETSTKTYSFSRFEALLATLRGLSRDADYLVKKMQGISKRSGITLGEVKALEQWRPNICPAEQVCVGKPFLVEAPLDTPKDTLAKSTPSPDFEICSPDGSGPPGSMQPSDFSPSV